MDAEDPGRIADLLRINQHLVVSCSHPDCRRERRIPAVEAVRMYGPRTTLTQAARRSRCSHCGSRGAHGFITVQPCTLDLSAWSARQDHAQAAARGEELSWPLDKALETYRRLARGQLGGDGPVQWPPEDPSTTR